MHKNRRLRFVNEHIFKEALGGYEKEICCQNIRNLLFSTITKVASEPDNCAKTPEIDFTRNRKLPLSTMLLMLIGMGGGSLMEKLHEWFDLAAHAASIFCTESLWSRFLLRQKRRPWSSFPMIQGLQNYYIVCFCSDSSNCERIKEIAPKRINHFY